MRERIIELCGQIAALRDEIKGREAELDRLLAHPIEAMTTISDQIIKALRGCAGSLNAKEMRHVLGMPEERVDTIRTTLQRLATEGKIKRESPGRFCASQK